MTLAYTARQAAMWHAQHGYAVLPLHGITDAGGCTCGDTTCKSPGKHPLADITPNGLKDATLDIDTVNGWFEKRYWANYGVLTDALFVIDVDVRKNGIETWYATYSQPTRFLPHTRTVTTGSGGQHVFFQPPPNSRSGTLDSGIDIKGKGGYVVGAGSKHAAGGFYDWTAQCSPDEAPLAEVPPWLMSLLETRCYLGKVTPPSEWRRVAGSVLKDGERHAVFGRLAGHLIANPLNDPIEIRELLLGWNRGRCDPPLPDREVVEYVERLCEKERAKGDWLK
jgi:bifunctional DNA primase/polymerase-like protein